MKYDIRMTNGQEVTVTLPDRIRFDHPRPRTVTEARSAIATLVARAVAPNLRPRPPEKRVVRNDIGLIERIIDVPGASVNQQAAAVGQTVAEAHLAGIEE